MSFNIIPTPPFEKELKQLVKKYPSIKSDIISLVKELQKEPRIGTPLGSNCYKIRMAITSKGKGKSGGVKGNKLNPGLIFELKTIIRLVRHPG